MAMQAIQHDGASKHPENIVIEFVNIQVHVYY